MAPLVFLRRLRILGKIEGISTLVLFGIAMPLKYAEDMRRDGTKTAFEIGM